MVQYSTDLDPDKTAKAYGFELHCSPKDSKNIARALRGMELDLAKTYLEDIIDQKRALPAIFHKRKVAHRSGIGPGTYPQKAARYILKILKNAENNAEYKGFDIEHMRIAHITTYRGRKTRGVMPRAQGRATDWNKKTTNIEIIIEEVE
ncbi:MAG: 50S ribosomal protein L22 [Candidatus Thermoplasmatota archaeon]|nr:50S ribosomal protein L22 [Candidatus Thermoplasmatota archaeon]